MKFLNKEGWKIWSIELFADRAQAAAADLRERGEYVHVYERTVSAGGLAAQVHVVVLTPVDDAVRCKDELVGATPGVVHRCEKKSGHRPKYRHRAGDVEWA